jgi:hypothetical protein
MSKEPLGNVPPPLRDGYSLIPGKQPQQVPGPTFDRRPHPAAPRPAGAAIPADAARDPLFGPVPDSRRI